LQQLRNSFPQNTQQLLAYKPALRSNVLGGSYFELESIPHMPNNESKVERIETSAIKISEMIDYAIDFGLQLNDRPSGWK